ncbi:MAG TPA: sulfur relay protein DsrC [Chromatiales bacterium]|nr:sulfur relay protein DsrC [Chromatiales bacterium]
MLWLSEILLQHHELETFEELEHVVRELGQRGERFLRMDVKPQFEDTPEDWEDRLEAAFTAAKR